MVTLNKTGKSYLWQLLALGIIYFIIGIGLLYMTFTSIASFSLYDLPLMIVGMTAGYLAEIRFDAGGWVNYYNDYRERTKDDISLNNLVIKYKSTFLMKLTTGLLFVFILLLATFKHDHNGKVSIADQTVGDVFWVFIITMMTLVGVKYISAWWNIKRNMK